MGTITTSDGTRSFRGAVVLAHGWPLNADAWDDQAKGEVEEETMTITDPLTVQVADLPGITRDIQSA
jgi:hypothetical protein